MGRRQKATTKAAERFIGLALASGTPARMSRFLMNSAAPMAAKARMAFTQVSVSICPETVKAEMVLWSEDRQGVCQAATNKYGCLKREGGETRSGFGSTRLVPPANWHGIESRRQQHNCTAMQHLQQRTSECLSHLLLRRTDLQVCQQLLLLLEHTCLLLAQEPRFSSLRGGFVGSEPVAMKARARRAR